MAFGLDLSILRTVEVRTQRIAVDLYDKISGFPILPLIAQTMLPQGNQMRQYFEWSTAFPMLSRWLGERQRQRAFKSKITVDIEPWETTYPLNQQAIKMDGESALIRTPEEMAKYFVQAVTNAPAEKSFVPLRTNAICTYDNLTYFNANHLHPDGETFDNIVDLSDLSASRATTGVPTLAESGNELRLAIDRLETNRLKNLTLTPSPDMSNLVVIAKSQSTWSAYHQLLTKRTVNSGDENEFFGTFTLLRDRAPASGDEKKLVVILAEPGGPRPLIFCPHTMPGPISYDRAQEFRHATIDFGIEALFGFGLGFPQSAVLIQE